MSMRCIAQIKSGGPDVLQLLQIAKPTPAGLDVLIKNRAVATNPVDCARMILDICLGIAILSPVAIAGTNTSYAMRDCVRFPVDPKAAPLPSLPDVALLHPNMGAENPLIWERLYPCVANSDGKFAETSSGSSISIPLMGDYGNFPLGTYMGRAERMVRNPQGRLISMAEIMYYSVVKGQNYQSVWSNNNRYTENCTTLVICSTT
ncbi:hypothetical protein M427DRAFT_36428 [Gonapodya prolifera JEL478]|uniref:Uncharacterized protein n=1 Tax=Gonapodya prolifera (strain JEL478) TaxID=1344416 RepID=A0A139A2E4_GONPJ|nr:hypothetical protein M427DRAFT_36428 [Gonapodya prolifera JEL478]|eukprot:KXS10960.1 hypothetical protein M427DRAFT_36428 [Gonapodya prolifera JEL478]